MPRSLMFVPTSWAVAALLPLCLLTTCPKHMWAQRHLLLFLYLLFDHLLPFLFSGRSRFCLGEGSIPAVWGAVHYSDRHRPTFPLATWPPDKLSVPVSPTWPQPCRPAHASCL